MTELLVIALISILGIILVGLVVYIAVLNALKAHTAWLRAGDASNQADPPA